MIKNIVKYGTGKMYKNLENICYHNKQMNTCNRCGKKSGIYQTCMKCTQKEIDLIISRYR